MEGHLSSIRYALGSRVRKGAVHERGLLVARVDGINDDANLAARRTAAVEGGGFCSRVGPSTVIDSVSNAVKIEAELSPTNLAMTHVVPLVDTCHSAQLSVSGRSMV